MIISREFIGVSEEEIIKKALDTLKLREDQIKVDFKTESDGIFKKNKNITASVYFEEDLLLGNRSLLFVRDLLEKMDIDAKIYLIEENDEKIVIEIESPDSALIIGKKGKNLEAIQTIVNAAMNKRATIWTKVIIDIGNYRNRREKRLQQLALDVATQVKEEKKSMLLEPMNPFERRIIHMTLRNESNIETNSEGTGNIKRIRVSCNTDK